MTETAVDKKWYVLRVQSGREEQVRDGLLRRVQAAGLSDRITSVIVPMEKVTEIRSGRKSVREKKLYPGYIVVEMALTEDTWFLVRETPGIGDFLGDTKPEPMHAHEVQRIVAEEKPDEESRPKIKIEFVIGDNVRIKDGPFENFDGVVEEIDSTKGRVRVSVVVFGRPTPVDIEYWQIEKT